MDSPLHTFLLSVLVVGVFAAAVDLPGPHGSLEEWAWGLGVAAAISPIVARTVRSLFRNL